MNLHQLHNPISDEEFALLTHPQENENVTEEEFEFFAEQWEWEGPPDWEDEVDPDDCDISDLVDTYRPRFYDGGPEEGQQEPVSWIETVERADCDHVGCGATNQRVLERKVVNERFDATVMSKLACGHWVF